MHLRAQGLDLGNGHIVRRLGVVHVLLRDELVLDQHARALECRQPLSRDPEGVRHRETHAFHAEIDGQNPP